MNRRYNLFYCAIHLFISAILIVGSDADEANTNVDLELVLAVDASVSMDIDERNVQRDGYISALQQPEIIRAIESGLYRRVALTYVEWGEPGQERVVVPWTLVSTPFDAKAFASKIAAATSVQPGRTSISRGLLFATQQFYKSPFWSMRRVIDVSGDGPNNAGPPVDSTRDGVVRLGVTINGLAITTKGGEGFGWQPWKPRDPDILATYYRECVVGGPGSFVVAVSSADGLEAAIRQKLILEISGLPALIMKAGETRTSEGVDCQVGEKNLMPPDPGHPKPFN